MSNRFERVRFDHETVMRVTRSAFLLTGMLSVGASAFAQSIPDAQVEANVLKSLASSPELASQSISTNTASGVVTLSGSVSDEQARTKAENLAANANGVKKVVDELRVGNSSTGTQTASAQQPGQQGAQPLVLQSDGTYAPAPATGNSAPNQSMPPQDMPRSNGADPALAGQPVRNNPEADQQLDLQTEQQQTNNSQGQQPQAQYSQPRSQYPPQPQYPQQQGQYPQQPQYPQAQGQYPRPLYPPQYPPNGYPQYAANQASVPGGQVGGESVIVPNGSLLRVRINRFLASDKTPAGTTFDGVISNDVVAGGQIAIPRGATVHGTVIDAKSSGVLKGRGEMSVQLTSVTLGGKTYPLVSDVWQHNGADKTIQTINSTAALGGVGAIFGALAGGGVGAAVGGGIGAAAGLGSSAASHTGQVVIPAEAMLVFHTAQDTPVMTLSEAEMQRLAYGIPAGGDQRAVRRPYPYPPGYYPYYPYGPAGYPYR